MVKDDGRSGSIRELDVRLAWYALDDRMKISLGWEQWTWDELAADLVRNFPGTSAPLRDRDEVVFSGYIVGFQLTF